MSALDENNEEFNLFEEPVQVTNPNRKVPNEVAAAIRAVRRNQSNLSGSALIRAQNAAAAAARCSQYNSKYPQAALRLTAA